MTPQQLAEACAATLWAPDICSQWLGMHLEEVRPGYARIRIRNEAGETVAMFRGRAAQRPGEIVAAP